MKKFILLFRGSDVYETDQPPEALEMLTAKMMVWVDHLIKKGQHVSSEKWNRPGRTIKAGDRTVDHHPFENTREMIGGCTIVSAKDYDEAVAIASACPILETNASIEIRAIESL